jgi:hypothetical protein
MFGGAVFGVQCAFQIGKVRLCQMNNHIRTGEKKKQEKKRGMVLTVGDVGGAVFRVQHAFPNMESEAVPNEK